MNEQGTQPEVAGTFPSHVSTGTIDVLIKTAESLVNEFVSRRQKLEELHSKIGQLLSSTAAISPNGRQAPPPAPRRVSESMEAARNKIIEFLRSNPDGLARGDIAKELGIDTSVVSRALTSLSDEGQVEMLGQRRAAHWRIRKH